MISRSLEKGIFLILVVVYMEKGQYFIEINIYLSIKKGCAFGYFT